MYSLHLSDGGVNVKLPPPMKVPDPEFVVAVADPVENVSLLNLLKRSALPALGLSDSFSQAVKRNTDSAATVIVAMADLYFNVFIVFNLRFININVLIIVYTKIRILNE